MSSQILNKFNINANIYNLYGEVLNIQVIYLFYFIQYFYLKNGMEFTQIQINCSQIKSEKKKKKESQKMTNLFWFRYNQVT